MPYTSQGYMTAVDLEDHRKQTDTGVTTYPCDDLPDHLRDDDECPLDGMKLAAHDGITVADASGEIIACTPHPRRFVILSRWLDGEGDEWWEIEGEGYRLAGRSATSSMAGWTRAEVEDRFGQLTPYDPTAPS